MIKKILLSSLMLLSLYSFGQEGTASPYSFFGIGEVKFKGTVENKSMGGLGILPDSIHMNLQNPASLSSLKLTSFAIGATNSNTALKTNTNSDRATRTTLDYLAMAFPIGKLGLSLGMMPYSAVGYKIRSLTLDENNHTNGSKEYKGNGGLNKVFLGGSYKITPKISVGADLGYVFGKIESRGTKFLNDAQFGSRELNKSELSGLNINTGLIYQTKLSKYDFVSSLTYSATTNLNSKNEQNIATVTYTSNGSEVIWDKGDVIYTNTKFKLPSKLAIGAGIGEIKKWFVGFESTFQQSNNFGNRYNDIYNVSFENASKYSLGGYFIPKYNSFSSYFNKITYRAGLRYENTGLVVNTKSIKDQAFTFGLGFPVGGNVSSINVGMEVGKRGTTTANLIQENYTNLSIGLSFGDRWFVKRKYD